MFYRSEKKKIYKKIKYKFIVNTDEGEVNMFFCDALILSNLFRLSRRLKIIHESLSLEYHKFIA